MRYMGKERREESPFKIYDCTEIRKVYQRHAYYCGTVVYSTDGGYVWQSVGMDSGKWDTFNWLFAFIEMTPNQNTVIEIPVVDDWDDKRETGNF